MNTHKRSLWVAALCLISVLVAQGQALAQSQPDRGGFTVLVNMGFGIQHDSLLEESANGLAGLNLGVGGFLTEDLALTFRISSTNVSYDFGTFDVGRVSVVTGPTLQYWASDRFNIEAGIGAGLWETRFGVSETGFGVILGAAVTIFNRGKHNLQVGFEYAPAFTDSTTAHNAGFSLGYQFL